MLVKRDANAAGRDTARPPGRIDLTIGATLLEFQRVSLDF
jgi:hypothetical protein